MASCSTLVPPPRKYDVFLSFRGEDTRHGFVARLYDELQRRRGLETFIDDDLRRGKEISPALMRAIEQSKLALIVFSENYGSSPWCLDELLHILECRCSNSNSSSSRGKKVVNGGGLIVVPVFYKVDPSDVRRQQGNFAQAFSNHERDYAHQMETVQRWRAALVEAASISGWDTRNTANGDEEKCLQAISTDVYNKLGPAISNKVALLEEGLVGINPRVEKVCSLLDIGSDHGVRIIGLWGMGGIGKTTIAEIVYHRIAYQFDHKSFLRVSKIEKEGGPEALKETLLSIKFILRHEKGLIVLDDVDQIDQLDVLVGQDFWIFSGSRIIITSRDARLLQKYAGEGIYEVRALETDEALQLFSSKAFGLSYPPDDYVQLSFDTLRYAAGLPLALKVLGSSLFGRDKIEWNDTLGKLKKAPAKDILQVLKISFDKLDELEKQIFLDIACFFEGEERDHVTRILEGCGFHPVTGIKALIERSLITVCNNCLQMHAMVQEMGWNIVCMEDKEPGRCSRIWTRGDVYHALMENTVTDAVEGISLRLPKPEDVNFNIEGFKKMNKLRVAVFHNARISHGPEYFSNKLSLLDWEQYPSNSLPAGFIAENLVELHMTNSSITELWKGIKILGKLRTISLSGSHKLERTPDFTGLPNLEELTLSHCTSLVDVHPSIAFHKKLISLKLDYCRSLKSLADSIHLESLDFLSLGGCQKFEKFPVILGKMEKALRLNLGGTAIKELPSSIEQLSGVVSIHLIGCKKLASLPDNICTLRSLELLYLSECLKLERLPENLGEMESLEEIVADGTAIKQLPSSTVSLKKLRILHFRDCKERTRESGISINFSCFLPRECQNSMGLSCFLPRECETSMGLELPPLSGLQSLTELDLSGSHILDGILPNDLGCLSSLTMLCLSGTNIFHLPKSIAQLSQLKQLRLCGCYNLEALPKPPPRIAKIYTDNCTSLTRVADPLSGCELLEYISLVNCSRLVENQQDNLVDRVVQWLPQKISIKNREFRFALPGSEIPNWFNYQSRGSSISIELPPNWRNDVLGIAFCAVYENVTANSSDQEEEEAVNGIFFPARHGHEHENVVSLTIPFNIIMLDYFYEKHIYMVYVPITKLISMSRGRGRNMDEECRFQASTLSFRGSKPQVILGKGVAKKLGIHLVSTQVCK